MKQLIDKLKAYLQDKDEKNLVINIFGAFAIKGVSLFLSVFATPMYIKYFNDDVVLGIWYTVLSILSWISICDLGLSSGLRNRLTESLTLGNDTLSKQYVSSTYVMLSLIVLPLVLLGNVVVSYLDLNTLLNVSKDVISPETLKTGVSILLTGIGLSFIFKIINAVIYAIQKPTINNILSLISSWLPFLFVSFYRSEDTEKNFILLAIVHTVSMILPLLVASVWVFSLSRFKKIRPALTAFQKEHSGSLFSLGLNFFVAQVFFLVLMSTNETLITVLYGSEHVVQYNAYYRLFLFAGSWITLALTPLWSKITKDVAQKKYGKLHNTKKVLYLMAVGAVVCEILLIPLLQFIMDLWLRENSFAVSISTAIAFALFGSMHILNSILTTFANGLGAIKSQIVFYGIGAVLKFPVMYSFCNVFGDWNLVVWFNALVLLAFNIYQLTWTEKKIKKLMEES